MHWYKNLERLQFHDEISFSDERWALPKQIMTEPNEVLKGVSVSGKRQIDREKKTLRVSTKLDTRSRQSEQNKKQFVIENGRNHGISFFDRCIFSNSCF